MSVKKKDKCLDKQLEGWQRALGDAKRQLGEAQATVQRLRRSVKIIEEKISTGESWPGTLTTQN